MSNEPPKPDPASKPEQPGYKKFGGAKLVAPPAPIQQLGDEEKFPVFLGVAIGVSIVALITVIVMAFFSHKTPVRVVPAGIPMDSPALHSPSSITPSSGVSPPATSGQH